MHILNKDIKFYSELPSVAPVINELPTNAEGYGSFFIKVNNDGCFQIKQRLHPLLFDAFKLVFNTTHKITIDQGLYAQFSVSSKSDIQNVINFFSFSGRQPLVGLKSVQYSAWLEKLRNSERYSKLNFPSS
ncbi:putative homing endonuclease [Tuber indicum]|nr:putative homing endonuclease [Tuber indicum]